MNTKTYRGSAEEHVKDMLLTAAAEKLWGFEVQDTSVGDSFMSLRLLSIGDKPDKDAEPGSIVHIRKHDVLAADFDSADDEKPGWIAVDRGATVYEQTVTARPLTELQLMFLAPDFGGFASKPPTTIKPNGDPITDKPPTTIQP